MPPTAPGAHRQDVAEKARGRVQHDPASPSIVLARGIHALWNLTFSLWVKL